MRIDTDLPVHGEIASRPDLSADAAVDTVRVDALPSDGSPTPYEVDTYFAPDLTDWPVSFGVETDHIEVGKMIRLRIRAFAGARGLPGRFTTMVKGKSESVATLDPPTEVTVDRFVEIPAEDEGVQTIEIVLRGDCIGAPSLIGTDGATTCIDAGHLASDAKIQGDGDVKDGGGTLIGTWAPAVEKKCQKSPPPGAVCIPGGFTIIGDSDFQGVADSVRFDSIPLKPTPVNPSFLDVEELDVRTLRQLVLNGYDGPLPDGPTGTAAGESQQFCSWLGPNDEKNDALPVNCLTLEAASAICAARGGYLPTEVRWEHAARGRGQARLFPWGDQDVTCCAASLARSGLGMTTECMADGSGPENIGAHDDPSKCAGIADISRDGVKDLGGSMTEMMRDFAEAFDQPCWKPTKGGLHEDGYCAGTGANQSGRGGNWHDGTFFAAGASRIRQYADDGGYGMRCAYDDEVPAKALTGQ